MSKADAADSSLTILVVDDESSWLNIYVRKLTTLGHRVLATDRPIEALKLVERESIEVALLDLRMFFPSSDEEFGGLELLKRLRSRAPELPVVIISAHGSIERAFEIMRRGAFDFVEKPVDWVRLQAVVQRAGMTRSQFLREVALQASVPRSGQDQTPEAQSFEGIVFLCHNSLSKPAVRRIAQKLQARGLRTWLDEHELRPGLPWQKELEQQISKAAAAAIFVDGSGIGPWQDREIDALLRHFVQRNCPVIPVILPGCEATPPLPLFLGSMAWVDFRKRKPNPLEQLIFGITGSRSKKQTK